MTDKRKVESSTAQAVWLDCDPGHDDAIAILLCANHPSLQLIGVSACSGNQSVDKTWANAIKIMDIAGSSHIPVYCGQSRPLLKDPKHDPGIHGESGIDGSPTLNSHPSREIPLEWKNTKGVIGMAQGIQKYTDNNNGENVTIIATGALTNVALMLTLYPELHSKINKIVFMGGALGVGNRHPVAEFNILCDPEAARIVCDSSIDVVMVPLEVTHTAIFNDKQRKALQTALGEDNALCKMVVELMTFFSKTYKEVFGFLNGGPVHDACAVAYVIDSNIFNSDKMHVTVVTGDHLCAGQTVCDQWRSMKNVQDNVIVTTKMNVEQFWKMLIDSLVRCSNITTLKNSTECKEESK
jgi:uridine nucleosidase